MIDLKPDSFIAEVFKGLQPDEHLWMASISGCPDKAKTQAPRKWNGRSAKPADFAGLNPDCNLYFNVSSLRPGPNGEVKRTKECFSRVFCLVLDDVGTKSRRPDIEPSWRFETSPGNEQWGLILADPCADLGHASAVLSALGDAGFSDRGASGPSSRYVRLPGGTNAKASLLGGPFKTVVHEWQPSRRYTLEQITVRLRLEVNAPASTLTKAEPKARAKAVGRAAGVLSDSEIMSDILRSPKARRVWEGDPVELGGGSEADQWLLNLIAYRTPDRVQIERVYGLSARVDRVSSDGVRKWRDRADYRKRCIDAALAYVEANPSGDPSQAEDVLTSAIAEAAASGDARGLCASDCLEAFETLKKADRASFDHYRALAKKAGAKLGTLDAEARKLAGQTKLLDIDAARMTIDAFGGAESLIHTQSSWFQWTGSHWHRMASDEPIRAAVVEALPKAQVTASVVTSVVSLMRTLCHSDRAMDPASDEIVIPCANGELVFVGPGEGPRADPCGGPVWQALWELRPHRREALRTSVLPLEWDENADCPSFLRYLDSITSKDEPDEAAAKKRVIMEAIGYSLTSWTGLERFVILYGPSASNGKSTLLNLIGKLTGPENTTALTMTRLGGRFDLAKLQGSLVNLCPEIARGEVIPEAVVKSISSGDLITVERKGRDVTEIRPTATLWFATNTLPTQRDLSPALLEKRCLLIELTRSFEGDDTKDTRLGEKLGTELPGILRACVEAFGRALEVSRMPVEWRLDDAGALQPHGFSGVKPMEDTPAGQLVKAAWKQESDPVRVFASEHLVFGDEFKVSSADLYAGWLAWREAEGVKLDLPKAQLVKRLAMIEPGLKTSALIERGVRGVIGCGLPS